MTHSLYGKTILCKLSETVSSWKINKVFHVFIKGINHGITTDYCNDIECDYCNDRKTRLTCMACHSIFNEGLGRKIF